MCGGVPGTMPAMRPRRLRLVAEPWQEFAMRASTTGAGYLIRHFHRGRRTLQPCRLNSKMS